MAYVSKETKQVIAPEIKRVLKKWKMKGSISGQGSATLKVTINAGPFSLPKASHNHWNTGYEYYQVNPYWYQTAEGLSGSWKNFLSELESAMKGSIWFDKSDSMTDYFHTAYYIDMQIGAGTKEYRFEPKLRKALLKSVGIA
tara:strand:+ start:27289 stop:27714 length:426 start_codon:yes stop_codon:yes gene_type:complete